MTPGRRRFQRLCAILLLALAASPLTAPFSAGHPLDLLGGDAAHLQSKKAPDEPAAGFLPGPAILSVCAAGAPLTRASIESRCRGLDALSIPLRL